MTDTLAERHAETARRLAPRRRETTAAVVVGALDGLLAAALPVVVLAAVGVVAWAGLGAPAAWGPFARAGAVAWWIGHGVDVRFGGAGAGTVTAAALGPALISVLAGARAGRRAARTAAPTAAWAACAGGAALASGLILALASSATAAPAGWQAVLAPTAVVALAALGALRAARASRPLPAGVRTGLAAAALLLAAAGVLLAALLLARFPDVVGLYETLGAGPAGGLVLTLLQVLALPTLVVWTGGWVSGAGVSLGVGSTTGAFGSQLGPLPALPVLAVVPADPGPAAAVLLLLPVLAGFAAGALVARSGGAVRAVPLGLVAGAVAGAVLGLLTAASSGAAGPGRFEAVGPSAPVVALLVAVLTGLPAMLAAAVVRPRATAEEGPAADQ